MPFGLVLLFALAALIFFGLAERVLDRMRLTDTQALLFIGLMIAGSFLSIPIGAGNQINVGGALVPLALVVYLLVRAGTPAERWRAIGAAVVTGIAVFAVARLLPSGPHAGSNMLIDPLWLFGITAGVVAYLAGRSRRAAFVAGVGGLLLYDFYSVLFGGASTEIGGAGVFDQIVIGGVLAVALAELIGETRERLQGGPEQEGDRPEALRKDEGTTEEPARVFSADHTREGGDDNAQEKRE